MNPAKQFVRSMVRGVARRAPWSVREALLEGYIDRASPEVLSTRLLRRLNIAEIGASGDRGVLSSAWNDSVGMIEYAKAGTFDPAVTRTIVDFFGDAPGTYMDVGANIGLMTIPIARQPKVRCLAFEPEPLNFGFLQRNVARNVPGATVEFHQVALFERRGTMTLGVSDGNLGDHRLMRGADSDRRAVEVDVVPLDDFAARIEGPLAVKVDTQGAEPFVIAGGRQVFAKAGLIALEFCPYLMKQLGGDPKIVIDLVAGFDRVALMSDTANEIPSYMSADAASAMLEQKLVTALPSGGDFLDILAYR